MIWFGLLTRVRTENVVGFSDFGVFGSMAELSGF